MRTALAVSIFALMLSFAPSANAAGCVPVESQSWWTPQSSPLPFPGDMQHVHAGACFPYKQVLTGSSYTLEVTAKMHNEAGRWLNYVRIDDATDQDPQKRYSVSVHEQCQVADCTYVVPVTVPIGSLPTGMHEWRVGVSSSPVDSSATTFNRNLATNGWQVCIRSCSGRTPANNNFEGRGWYMNEFSTSFHEGYDVVTWNGTDAEFPWNPATGAYRSISGVWTPPLSLHLGAHDLSQTIDRSRCWVDPDFHHGSAGTQVLNAVGPFTGRLSIDTTQFLNGLHKLVCAVGTDEQGHLDGVQVFPFQVANP